MPPCPPLPPMVASIARVSSQAAPRCHQLRNLWRHFPTSRSIGVRCRRAARIGHDKHVHRVVTRAQLLLRRGSSTATSGGQAPPHRCLLSEGKMKHHQAIHAQGMPYVVKEAGEACFLRRRPPLRHPQLASHLMTGGQHPRLPLPFPPQLALHLATGGQHPTPAGCLCGLHVLAHFGGRDEEAAAPAALGQLR